MKDEERQRYLDRLEASFELDDLPPMTISEFARSERIRTSQHFGFPVKLWTLEMPWPKPPLSLNDRPTTHERARLTAMIRRDTYTIAKAAKIPPQKHLTVQLVWTHPDKVRRDDENPVPTQKAVCDALAAPTRSRKKDGTVIISPGLLIVPDDTAEYMTKLMPRLRYEKGVSRVDIEIEGTG